MTVIEPVVPPVRIAEETVVVEDALPEQREVAARQVDGAGAGVHRHSQKCYWDFRVARWECAGD